MEKFNENLDEQNEQSKEDSKILEPNKLTDAIRFMKNWKNINPKSIPRSVFWADVLVLLNSEKSKIIDSENHILPGNTLDPKPMDNPHVISYIRKVCRSVIEEELQNNLNGSKPLTTNKNEPEGEKNSFRFLLFLVGLTYPSDQREDMLGHLIERYNKHKETVGGKYARIWIVRDCGESILPIVYGILRSKTIRLLRRIGLEVVLKYFLG